MIINNELGGQKKTKKKRHLVNWSREIRQFKYLYYLCKIVERNINNLRYTDNTTLMAEIDR